MTDPPSRAQVADGHSDNPHAEHDFDAITVVGFHCFRKIDCYDLDLRFASPDPAASAVTTRVLTFMLAEDY